MTPDQTSVARLVVRPPNWLGDAVMALPAIAALRRHFAASHLTIAAVPAVAAVFREETEVRPDAVVDLTGSPAKMTAAFRGGGYELGVLFPNSFRSAWMLRQAGISQRWGYGTGVRGWLLTRRSERIRVHGVQHQSEYYRALVRGLGVPCDEAPPRLGISPSTRDETDRLLQKCGVDEGARLVGFAPGAAYGQAKQWPPERVAEVMARLVRDRDATCLVFGAAHDRPAGRAVESWLRAHAPDALPRVVDLIGRTSLGSLAGATARCRVFVANDSGAMHVAAALGRPVVAIFGPTNERATRPIGTHELLTQPVFCRPCMLRDCPIDHRCMTRISTDHVFAAVSRHLAFART